MKFYLGLLTLSAILLTSCSATSIDKDVTEDADDLAGADIAVVEETTGNYVNDYYGFSLNFPDSWADYGFQERDLEWGDAGTAPSLDFGFELDDEFVSLMNISFYTPEQWALITSNEGQSPQKLGESGEWIIAGDGSQDAPTDLKSQRKDVETIFASFQTN